MCQGEATMNLKEWIVEFCKMHEQARQGTLQHAERNEYLAARDELARALLKAQRITLQAGQQPRRSIRASLALPMTLQLPAGRLSTLTLDISSGGFSAMLSSAPTVGLKVSFALKLGRLDPPIEGKAKLLALNLQGSGPRGSFSFDDLDLEMAERLEMTVFDAVVAQLRRTD
jgi:hypothetical protein